MKPCCAQDQAGLKKDVSPFLGGPSESDVTSVYKNSHCGFFFLNVYGLRLPVRTSY